ncbi:MAG: S8 family serine peptidase, partial [Caldilineaceae bacterium]|nr:S8 family serine peptidase [Caldilineaceae bacterium]
MSVIVRGADNTDAAQQVTRIGGAVTSDLWLIDSVAASIPRAKLTQLAAAPGIMSLVANHGVQSADLPFDGWVTHRRIPGETLLLNASLQTKPVSLPDGAIVFVTERNYLHIYNADGSERSSLRLSKGDYEQPPVVGGDGTIYLSGDKSITYAIDSMGNELWTYKHDRKVTAIALDDANKTLYLGDDKGMVTALSTEENGRYLWQFSSGEGDVTHILIGVGDAKVFGFTQKGYITALNPTGRRAWVVRRAEAAPFEHVTLAPHDGSVYVFGESRLLYAFDAHGEPKFQLRASSKITALPVVTPDGAILAGSNDGMLLAVNADGTERFRTSLHDEEINDLALSPDAATVYALDDDGRIIALDVTSGAVTWQYEADDMERSRMVVEEDGLIHMVDKRGDYTILNGLGVAVNRFDLDAKVWPYPILGQDRRHRVYIVGEENQIFVLTRLPDNRAGHPDVVNTDTPGVLAFANPVAVDVGADMLHTPHLPDQGAITGTGITVAVVDSGVQYGSDAQAIAAAQLEAQFLGQADFVQETCVEENGNRLGQQETGYCFQNAQESRDEYGHGSHVAGIIWSQYRDAVTDTWMGIAPNANLLSVRILAADGTGTYVDAIEGIQYVVGNQDRFNIRVLNLSISALPATPYFVDPLNQAVERAWANGIVVLAAAGNEGPESGSITVPGNDPYIITVGAIDNNRTPGYWMGDTLPIWSATGPTHDGFIKPDVLAPGADIVSTVPESATISREHPDNRVGRDLFRMSGTSMSTAVASGVVALMLQANPDLSPDQIKYRLAMSARPAVTAEGYPVHSILQQGMGRIWAPTAVLGDFPEDGYANQGMDIESDLAHGWITDDDIRYHYQGPVERLTSDNGLAHLFVVHVGEEVHGIGAVSTNAEDPQWLTWDKIGEGAEYEIKIAAQPNISWSGGLALPSGMATWAGG